jgi:hypothetical protein
MIASILGVRQPNKRDVDKLGPRLNTVRLPKREFRIVCVERDVFDPLVVDRTFYSDCVCEVGAEVVGDCALPNVVAADGHGDEL